MTGSAVLGTAIGLGLVFGLLALFCSAVTEMISSFTERRARYLLTGLRSMLDREESSKGNSDIGAKRDKAQLARTVKHATATQEIRARVEGNPADATTGDLTIAIFGHPLVKTLQTRRVSLLFGGRIRNPQYVPPKVFARALMDTLVPATGPEGQPTPAGNLLVQVADAANRLPASFPARRSILTLVKQADGSLEKFEASLENWYDDQMGRISGWYKRWAKVVLIIAGFLIAMVINVDAIQVARGLYVDAPVREAVVAQAINGSLCQQESDAKVAKDCADRQIASLGTQGLPIGYAAGCSRPMSAKACWTSKAGDPFHWYDVAFKLLGWALTAFAVSFGAPFWFDALSRLGSLRSSGTKPAAK
jgi:hypothetical protein